MGEIIQLHVGQAGVQMANACWELYCLEHGIQPNGTVCECPCDNSYQNVFVLKDLNKAVPRAILVDAEPTVIDQVRTGPFRHLYSPTSLITGKEDSGSNFARGYYTTSGELLEITMEAIRNMAESSSNLQGFMTYRSIGGGTGSGLGNAIAERIHDDYDKASNLEFVIFPSPSISPLIVEPYNALIATHLSMDTIQCSFVLENEALYNICESKLNVCAPKYTNLNRIIAQTASTFTTSQRFGGTSNMSFLEIVTNLVPYPRIHFPLVSFAPFIAESESAHTNLTTEQITNACFDSSCQLVQCNPSQGKYMACVLLYRGSVFMADVNSSLSQLRAKETVQFVDWSPTGFKVGMNKELPFSIPGGDVGHSCRSLVTLSNNSIIHEAWCRLVKKYERMYSRRAFIHHFIEEGMEEDSLKEASDDIYALISDYKEVDQPGSPTRNAPKTSKSSVKFPESQLEGEERTPKLNNSIIRDSLGLHRMKVQHKETDLSEPNDSDEMMFPRLPGMQFRNRSHSSSSRSASKKKPEIQQPSESFNSTEEKSLPQLQGIDSLNYFFSESSPIETDHQSRGRSLSQEFENTRNRSSSPSVSKAEEISRKSSLGRSKRDLEVQEQAELHTSNDGNSLPQLRGIESLNYFFCESSPIENDGQSQSTRFCLECERIEKPSSSLTSKLKATSNETSTLTLGKEEANKARPSRETIQKPKTSSYSRDDSKFGSTSARSVKMSGNDRRRTTVQDSADSPRSKKIPRSNQSSVSYEASKRISTPQFSGQQQRDESFGSNSTKRQQTTELKDENSLRELRGLESLSKFVCESSPIENDDQSHRRRFSLECEIIEKSSSSSKLRASSSETFTQARPARETIQKPKTSSYTRDDSKFGTTSARSVKMSGNDRTRTTVRDSADSPRSKKTPRSNQSSVSYEPAKRFTTPRFSGVQPRDESFGSTSRKRQQTTELKDENSLRELRGLESLSKFVCECSPIENDDQSHPRRFSLECEIERNRSSSPVSKAEEISRRPSSRQQSQFKSSKCQSERDSEVQERAESPASQLRGIDSLNLFFYGSSPTEIDGQSQRRGFSLECKRIEKPSSPLTSNLKATSSQTSDHTPGNNDTYKASSRDDSTFKNTSARSVKMSENDRTRTTVRDSADSPRSKKIPRSNQSSVSYEPAKRISKPQFPGVQPRDESLRSASSKRQQTTELNEPIDENSQSQLRGIESLNLFFYGSSPIEIDGQSQRRGFSLECKRIEKPSSPLTSNLKATSSQTSAHTPCNNDAYKASSRDDSTFKNTSARSVRMSENESAGTTSREQQQIPELYNSVEENSLLEIREIESLNFVCKSSPIETDDLSPEYEYARQQQQAEFLNTSMNEFPRAQPSEDSRSSLSIKQPPESHSSTDNVSPSPRIETINYFYCELDAQKTQDPSKELGFSLECNAAKVPNSMMNKFEPKSDSRRKTFVGNELQYPNTPAPLHKNAMGDVRRTVDKKQTRDDLYLHTQRKHPNEQPCNSQRSFETISLPEPPLMSSSCPMDNCEQSKDNKPSKNQRISRRLDFQQENQTEASRARETLSRKARSRSASRERSPICNPCHRCPCDDDIPCRNARSRSANHIRSSICNPCQSCPCNDNQPIRCHQIVSSCPCDLPLHPCHNQIGEGICCKEGKKQSRVLQLGGPSCSSLCSICNSSRGSCFWCRGKIKKKE